ncbi:MAG: carboxypeptidase-like regulatory domain-containing protein [Verrucomicrobia bacterium]|nr:carboxypeptidase-like regulatory domain-containing protein [Verrucomicrobiota bacterium]
MKINRNIASGFILSAALAVVVWWLLASRHQPPKPTVIVQESHLPVPPAMRPTMPVSGQPSAEIPPKPRMFKSKGWPPTTPEQKEMWNWWNAMYKADPKFEWKTPIEFYGKAMDQFDEPVAGAKVTLMWSAMGGTQGKEELTDSDGTFSLKGAQGKGVSVEILKNGYLRTNRAYGSFEYAAFFEDNFHVPDPSKPVIFRLQKLTDAEPMYKYLPTGRVLLDGTPLMLNIATGKVGAGDVAFSIILGKDRGAVGPDYTLNIKGTGGAAFAPSDEEFLFSAPEAGYKPELTVTQVASDPKYSIAQKLRFYVKTSAGKYAAVEVEIDLRETTKNAGFFAIIYYNPSGSRNLEFDQRQWLNP